MAGDFVLDDLDLFFNTEELGDVASQHGWTLNGQFNRPFRGINSDVGMIESTDPTFMCKSSDVERLGIMQGFILSINEADYVVQGVEPGDPGITILTLRYL